VNKEDSVYAIKFYSMQKQIDEKQQEIERLNNIINIILEYNIFKDECPLNYGYATESDEEKAQEIFNDEYCKNCKDDYKKCWLVYFKKFKELKEGKE